MLRKIFSISTVLRILAVILTVLPLYKRLTTGRLIDDLIYKLYNDDPCRYLIADGRYVKVVLACIVIFAIIATISVILIIVANRMQPNIINFVLIVLVVLISFFNSLYIPHHYYRIYPDGYRVCDN